MDLCLLSLVVTPAIESAVIDWLLEREDLNGFTSMQVSGHGISHRSMTAAEQVAGRQKQVMFQLHLSVPTAQAVLQSIRNDFGGSGMHYWMSPVTSAGHID